MSHHRLWSHSVGVNDTLPTAHYSGLIESNKEKSVRQPGDAEEMYGLMSLGVMYSQQILGCVHNVILGEPSQTLGYNRWLYYFATFRLFKGKPALAYWICDSYSDSAHFPRVTFYQAVHLVGPAWQPDPNASEQVPELALCGYRDCLKKQEESPWRTQNLIL